MENLRSARFSPFVTSKVLAAHIRKSITAPARKNERTACILANTRKCSQRPFNTPIIVVSNNEMQSSALCSTNISVNN